MGTRIVTIKKPRGRGAGWDEEDPHQFITVTLESFYFTDGKKNRMRWRPIKATAAIEGRNGARKPGELIPIACQWASQTDAEETPAPFAAGGHLIADVLSGPNNPANIVPVSARTNDSMKTVEFAIRERIGARQNFTMTPADEDEDEALDRAGDFQLTVDVKYGHPLDKRVPSRFEYKLYLSKFKTVTVAVPRDEVMKGRKRLRNDQGQSKRVKTQELVQGWAVDQAWMTVNDKDSHHLYSGFAQHIQTLRTEIASKGWKVEDYFGDGHHISEAMKNVPLARRKYAVLDYFFLVKKGAGYVKPGTKLFNYAAMAGSVWYDVGAEFAPWQKNMVLRLMYASNGGFIKSDADGIVAANNTGIPVKEPHPNLIFGAAGNGPAYDHVLPLQKGGCNLFSNCQITSGAFNSRKGSRF